MKSSSKYGNFIVQGSILAIAGIVCRIIGMLYRIPLVDIIGTIGNGYYTSAYSIYNILLIVSSYSLPTAISKIVSVRLAKGRIGDVRRVLRVAFIYSTIVGAIMCAVMFFGAGAIAEAMGKPFCSYVLKTLAPTIWIMAYLGLLRGYFQGTGNMMPTAISQILEQIVNAAVSLIMAYMLFGYGERANAIYGETDFSFAYGAAGGTIGTGAGALVALLFFVLLLLLYGIDMPEEESEGGSSARIRGEYEPRRRGQREEGYGSRGRSLAMETGGRAASLQRRGRAVRPESYGHIARTLLVTLLPILVSSCVYNISTVLDDFLFSNIMTAIGLGSSVVLLWGIFGEYHILFNVPVAISNALSSSVIPSLTNAASERNKKLVVQKIRMSIRFTMLIAIPAAVGMIVLSEPICNLLFNTEDNATLIRVVQVGAVAVVFYSLSTITTGILQGLGHLSEPLRNSAIALVLHVAVLVFLLYVPKLGIYAVIISNIFFALVVCLLNSSCIHRHVRYKQNGKKTYLIPFIASLIMGVVCFLAHRAMLILLPDSIEAGRLGLMLIVGVCMFAAVLVYFISLLLLRAFNKAELMQMPMGMRIYRLARAVRLMD